MVNGKQAVLTGKPFLSFIVLPISEKRLLNNPINTTTDDV
jgi:hypothetical protein